MIDPVRRSLVLIGVVSVLALALLISSGMIVRYYVEKAFSAYQGDYDVRKLVDAALKLQLDEETGIRGLAATDDRVFLQPYRDARAPLQDTFDQLQVALQRAGLGAATSYLDDARRTNAEWVEHVAGPIVASPHNPQIRVEQYGKVLIDRFRGDFQSIDTMLRSRNASVEKDVRRSIDRITVLVALFVGLLLFAAIAYAVLQIRAAQRLTEEEKRAEDERRQRLALRAAYEAEKRVADTLQEAFTQRPLPSLATLQFSASYVPATEDTKVGGDWYDALMLANDRVFFAIGDVTGHGIDAAVTMNRARQALISSALLDSDPASILNRVNAEVARQDGRLISAIVGIADAAAYQFRYAAAGHPPPVLLEPGRAPRFLDCGSVVLGAVASSQYLTAEIQSVPGATLVLYTDGAVEHSRNVLEGEALLLRAVAEAGKRGEVDTAAFIHRTIFGERQVGDDVAILTVGFATHEGGAVTLSAEKAGSGLSGHIERSTDVVRRSSGRSALPPRSWRRIAS